MRALYVIQIVGSVIIGIAAATVLSPGSSTFERVLFVLIAGHVALASYFTTRAWQLRDTESQRSITFRVYASVLWAAGLVYLARVLQG